MPNEPKIKIDDLPKDEQELNEDELESVAGGLAKGGHVGASKWGNLRLNRASDPDSGEELA